MNQAIEDLRVDAKWFVQEPNPVSAGDRHTLRACAAWESCSSLSQYHLASHNPANLLRPMQTLPSLEIIKCSVQSKSCFISLTVRVTY